MKVLNYNNRNAEELAKEMMACKAELFGAECKDMGLIERAKFILERWFKNNPNANREPEKRKVLKHLYTALAYMGDSGAALRMEMLCNYDAEFAKLRGFKKRLQVFCTPDAPIHMANDGSLAAYTAAVEWSFSEQDAEKIPVGVFAHTLGTELGSGWVDEEGKIPQIPLEIYNCVIDLGSYPARNYDPTDVRSVSNFNTGLQGTLQKYTSQYGAYRIALRRFREEAPEEYEKLFALGYLEEREEGIFVVTKPKDRRKELLEYLMNLACSGQKQAEDVFREIGSCLSVATHVTNTLLAPKATSRVIFGRFVKKRRVFELMQEGANAHTPVELIAADGGLAFTPQMLELDAHPVYTVAQFGQAVGAMFYANS